MANLVCVTFGVLDRSMPALQMDSNIVSETFTSSGSNQQSAAAPTLSSGKLVANIVTDTAIYIAVGANPNALTSTTARKLVPAGGDIYIGLRAGEKVALVNA